MITLLDIAEQGLLEADRAERDCPHDKEYDSKRMIYGMYTNWWAAQCRQMMKWKQAASSIVI